MLLDARTVSGESALMKAAEAGHFEIVLYLLREGANPWLFVHHDERRTAAWIAEVNHPTKQIAEILIKYIAELEAAQPVVTGQPQEEALVPDEEVKANEADAEMNN